MGNKGTTSHLKPEQPRSNQPQIIPSFPTKELHKIKPLFPYSTTWRCTIHSDFSYLNKLRPKLLSHIKFANNQVENTRAKALRSMSRLLRDSKRSNISLTIEDSELLSRHLRYLINSTNHLKKIKILTIASSRANNRLLAESLVRIGRNKNLSELIASSAVIQLVKSKIAVQIRKQTKRLRKLESIFLNLPDEWKNFILSHHPARLLRSLDLLTTLDLDFHPKMFAPYFSKLFQCTRLKNFRLAFTKSHKTNSQEIQQWSSFFQKTQTLRNLTLIKPFKSCQDLENFKRFPECFKFMSQLTTLRLQLNNFSHQLVQDAQTSFFLCFSSHLKYLTQLQKLEFTISDNILFKKIHIEHFALFLQDLKNLEALELNFPQLESLSEGMIFLAKGLQGLSTLKHIKIRCKNKETMNISPQALEVFSRSIAHLQLKSLDLTFFDELFNIPPLQVEERPASLFRAISKCQDLSSLSLDFSSFFFSTQELNHLALTLKGLHKLSSVSLVLPQLCSTNNFQDLSSFLACFKDLPDLTSLCLTFAGDKLCDQEVDIIARNLNGCQHLSRLELFFKQADNLSKNSFDYLQAGLRYLTKLEHLKLRINTKRDFNLAFSSQFLARLTFLKRLKELNLRCCEAEKWSASHNKPMPLLLSKLYELKYLRNITVNGCRYI